MTVKISELSTEEKMMFFGSLLSALGLTLIQLGKLLKNKDFQHDVPCDSFSAMSSDRNSRNNTADYWRK